jgi:hypothetical protein
MSDNNGNNNGGNKPSAADKLTELLGFDPVKRPTLGPKGGKLFAEALAEITKERDEKAKAQAAELFRKAIALSEERNKSKKAFQQADQKFEKELGKVLNQIQGLVNGVEPQPENGNGDGENKEEATA